MEIMELKIVVQSFASALELSPECAAACAELATQIAEHNQACEELDVSAQALLDLDDFAEQQERAMRVRAAKVRLARSGVALLERCQQLRQGPLREERRQARDLAVREKYAAEANARAELARLFDIDHPAIGPWVEQQAVPRHRSVQEARARIELLAEPWREMDCSQQIAKLRRFIERARQVAMSGI